ncbi:hypothetical protein F5Y08DRAFT_5822 [Xylaria arbuscula]|nr:hypothetical protein F5Y08DRAFT_5822 [Xylaria arbuscula]
MADFWLSYVLGLYSGIILAILMAHWSRSFQHHTLVSYRTATQENINWGARTFSRASGSISARHTSPSIRSVEEGRGGFQILEGRASKDCELFLPLGNIDESSKQESS